jgi:hypothetical protein
MTAQERLRQAIDSRQEWLRATVPGDRETALLALISARDRLPISTAGDSQPDLVTGYRITDLGGNKALQVYLESPDERPAGDAGSPTGLDAWAEVLLAECALLAEAETVLGHCETGFMRLVESGEGELDAWVATRRTPPSWRERADFDWWAASLAPMRNVSAAGATYRQRADAVLKSMAYQFRYPAEAILGGCSVRTWHDILGVLIAWALQERDRGESPAPRAERTLVSAIASAIGADVEVVGRAINTLTVDETSAAWHAAVPGIAAAPLVRLDPDRVVWSHRGLTTEPLLFLARELRRRDSEAYHNTAWLREGAFRNDLYALFQDRRFVTSSGRIELRRAAGDVRTDIDAVVFDRKTGTLGLFELKSQDPFARSTAELTRQRDNVLYANRQISGVLDWLNRHGANDLLGRVDSRVAKTFRAHKVVPFVLGRYLAHFNDGPERDRRAAWGTWPQVLRLLEQQSWRLTDANPIASLAARLGTDPGITPLPADLPAREITLGDVGLVVHPSYAAYQASGAGARA